MIKLGMVLLCMILTGCASNPEWNFKSNYLTYTEVENQAVQTKQQVVFGGIVKSEPRLKDNGRYQFEVSNVRLNDQYQPIKRLSVINAPVFEVIVDNPQLERLSIGSQITVVGSISESQGHYIVDSHQFHLWNTNPAYQKVILAEGSVIAKTSGADWIWYCKRCERVRIDPSKVNITRTMIDPDKPNFGRSASKSPYKEL